MPEWNLNVQRILDLVERNLRAELSLADVSRRLGYSPWYCTRQFSRVVGMSLRSYLRLRRLSEAAIALRDSDVGILDIAVEFGFSSQEAFTRAFKDAWGTAPGAWRTSREPIGLIVRRHAASIPSEGGQNMSETISKIEVSVQAVPARKFIGVMADGATDYMDFWTKVAESWSDCHKVEGILASITANAQIGGWYEDKGRKGYVYGVEVPADYSGTVPAGMTLLEIPAAEYAVFHHPPYDFETMEEAVHAALGKALAAYDPRKTGREWDMSIPMWQRHDPEGMGQAWCKALKKK